MTPDIRIKKKIAGSLIENNRTYLEEQLVSALDEMGVTLKQPEIGTYNDVIGYRREASANDLVIEHKKLFEGNGFYELLEISPKANKKTGYNDFNVFYVVRGNSIDGPNAGSDEDIEYINHLESETGRKTQTVDDIVGLVQRIVINHPKKAKSYKNQGK